MTHAVLSIVAVIDDRVREEFGLDLLVHQAAIADRVAASTTEWRDSIARAAGYPYAATPVWGLVVDVYRTRASCLRRDQVATLAQSLLRRAVHLEQADLPDGPHGPNEALAVAYDEALVLLEEAYNTARVELEHPEVRRRLRRQAHLRSERTMRDVSRSLREAS